MLEIIIVDDSSDDLDLIERVFRREMKFAGSITLCQTGEQAISLIQARRSERTPFLMFLDLAMAPVSGLDVLWYWHASGCSHCSAVVMLSGRTEIQAIHAGYQFGARTFIAKPLRKEELVSTLRLLTDSITIKRSPGGCSLKWTGTAPFSTQEIPEARSSAPGLAP